MVTREILLETARGLAGKRAAKSPRVVQTLKQFVDRTLPRGPSEAAAYARQMTERTYTSEDLKEGLSAFADKRSPQFKGR